MHSLHNLSNTLMLISFTQSALHTVGNPHTVARESPSSLLTTVLLEFEVLQVLARLQ